MPYKISAVIVRALRDSWASCLELKCGTDTSLLLCIFIFCSVHVLFYYNFPQCHMRLHSARLLQAVLQFYHSTAGQAEINRWLTNAQISPNAWSFAWQLIQPQKVRFHCFCEDKFLLKITLINCIFRQPPEASQLMFLHGTLFV